jgi:hypothetical protein
MNLYIQLENGEPVNHPIVEENFVQAFPEIDLNNLPNNYARFERVPAPAIGVYEVSEGSTYEWVNGVVKDVHHVRAMTLEERTAKQNALKEHWKTRGLDSWVFDEESCTYQPPIPYPDESKLFHWDEATLSWIEINA